NVVIQFLHFRVDALQGCVGCGIFPQQNYAGDDVVVIDDFSVLAVNRARELAKPDLWTLRNNRNVFDPDGRAIFGQDDRAFDILGAVDQSDGTYVDLLQTFLDEASS